MTHPAPATDFNTRFYEHLAQIRDGIETLPEEQRPYFRSLADQAEQHHLGFERDRARLRDLVDDIRLNTAVVRFDLWAGLDRARRAFATCTLR